MRLTDTHAHLYWPDFQKDFDEILQRAKDAGVTNLINVGVDVEKSKEALRQAQGKLSNVSGLTIYSSIGIHPEEAPKYNSDESIHKDMAELEQIYLSDPSKVSAAGECGLDYSPQWVPTPQAKQLQRKLFQAQIDLAKKLHLPLLVHCRDDRSQNPANSEAWDEVLEMVGNHPTILHCYSGLSKTTQKVLKNPNLIVSFASTLTYPANDYLREAAKILPLDRIVLETDCPFLPPQSKRGTRNEPANVVEVAQTIADIKGISLEEVANQTTKNAFVIFNLKD